MVLAAACPHLPHQDPNSALNLTASATLYPASLSSLATCGLSECSSPTEKMMLPFRCSKLLQMCPTLSFWNIKVYCLFWVLFIITAFSDSFPIWSGLIVLLHYTSMSSNMEFWLNDDFVSLSKILIITISGIKLYNLSCSYVNKNHQQLLHHVQLDQLNYLQSWSFSHLGIRVLIKTSFNFNSSIIYTLGFSTCFYPFDVTAYRWWLVVCAYFSS